MKENSEYTENIEIAENVENAENTENKEKYRKWRNDLYYFHKCHIFNDKFLIILKHLLFWQTA